MKPSKRVTDLLGTLTVFANLPAPRREDVRPWAKPASATARCLLAVAVVIAGGLVSVSAAGADSEAAARKHAAKANQLAAKNKCKLALPWFNRAYRTLKDPTLLFNRAECLRKLGENHDAIRDYELFLTEMPTAPNRAVVEERIASLTEATKAAAPAGDDPAPAAAKRPSGLAPVPPEKTAEKPAASVEKAPAEPVRRAEKWTD
jgi:hypothetical protein